LVMALICAISSTTACSVSMEGKHWWIVQSAPVSAKKIFDSKILVNLTVAFPFYAVSVILLAASIQMSAAGCLLLIILPVVYILFTAVLGLFVNLRLPMMEWESEVRVVKQSGSVMITMLAGIAAAGIPFALSFIVPEPAKTLMLFLVCAGVLAAAAVLYRKNTRTRLTEI
ncbi:MAG: hypothetical protein Q4Q04_03715, partial [Methanocorpusculum sp.]|nr:hypothetical protein [Methanocorpusculum sp.]